ncbi:MAG: serine/threonine-protein kinase [Proteobacteria bacterium]|nr:serine/threonine-protein kinase [Pseudomonadota bacterium]
MSQEDRDRPEPAREADEAASEVGEAAREPTLSEQPTLMPSAAPELPPAAAAPADPGPVFAPGDVLFGAYEIIDVLGSGGMGAVYRARHLSLGGQRAIKVMHSSRGQSAELLERFHREAQSLLEVHHPAVVRCHDLLRDDHGRVVLVMEMIEGVSLAAHLLQNGPLAAADVRALGARVASGLAAAHARGVIHRDVSPDNIVLPDGRPDQAKLIDFGIAKMADPDTSTIAEGFKGKLGYASPEQLGFFEGRVDARSDFYSLGLVLCEAATGSPVQMGANFAQAADARRTLAEHPPELPAPLRKLIEPLLRFDPSERPEAVERLFYWEEGAKLEPRRRARWQWAAGLVVALGAAGLVLTLTDEPGAPVAPAVSAPPPALAPESPTAAPATEAFQALRRRLARAEGTAPDWSPRLVTAPAQVADGATYRVQVEANCACYALVFSLDGDSERIDLLYPNAYDAPAALAPGAPLLIPTSDFYSFEAVAGAGIDRLKVLVLAEEPAFPPAGTDFWSATPEEAGRMAELDTLLEGLAQMRWASAETALYVTP